MNRRPALPDPLPPRPIRLAVLGALATATAACGPAPSEPAAVAVAPPVAATPAPPAEQFELMEATISDIHAAIKIKSLTTTQLVELYLERIKAYNGTCVKEPDGMLGRIETIPNAGQINALATLNLRPATREQWGFDRAQGAQHDGLGRCRSCDARRIRDCGCARQALRRNRRARRPAARRGDRDQGSVRHVRHAHDVGRRRLLGERSPAR